MITFETWVYCKLRFSATHHCPPEVCPKEAEYLTHPHRHEFHVQCAAYVHGDNREIEFITLKNQVDKYVREKYHNKDLGMTSCEMIAHEILGDFDCLSSVEVSEDGENGAIAIRRKKPFWEQF